MQGDNTPPAYGRLYTQEELERNGNWIASLFGLTTIGIIGLWIAGLDVLLALLLFVLAACFFRAMWAGFASPRAREYDNSGPQIDTPY